MVITALRVAIRFAVGIAGIAMLISTAMLLVAGFVWVIGHLGGPKAIGILLLSGLAIYLIPAAYAVGTYIVDGD